MQSMVGPSKPCALRSCSDKGAGSISLSFPVHPQVLLQDHQEECPCPDEYLAVDLRTVWSGVLLGDLGEHPWNDRLVLCRLLGNSAHPVFVYPLALDLEQVGFCS